MLPLMLALAADPTAETPPPEPTTQHLEASVAVTEWRLGFQANLKYGPKRELWDRPGSTLLDGTNARFLADLTVSPAFTRVGTRIVFEPLAILSLTGFAKYNYYFGNFQTVIGFDSPDSSYGTNSELADLSANQGPGAGWAFGGAVTLKAKAGPAVFVANSELTRWTAVSDVEGDYWFEREYELLIGFEDATIASNLLIMYELEIDKVLIRAGSITTHRTALSTDDILLRTGLIATAGHGSFSRALLIQPYLIDRAFDSAFPPFVAYNIKFQL